jgi:hypothetical protein
MNKKCVDDIKLEIIERLMVIYIEGTSKNPDHKDENGNYEIIKFIQESIKILNRMVQEKIEINDNFIEDFFNILFKYKNNDDVKHEV